jgi:cytochrome c oxidase assembly protein subunit 15
MPADLASAAHGAAAAQAGRRARPGLVSAWLIAIAALIVCMIVLGGLTRLTDSGLSITEWKPVTGAVPPLSEAAWEAELEKYRQIPEYQLQNRGMTLSEFQAIYWWEWGHRLLGRLIGLAFALPLAGFWIAGALPRGFKGRLLVLLALGGLQGAVGWWMVASGLTERLDVSQYRLATHLGLAFALLGAVWWTALDVRAASPVSSSPASWRPSRDALIAGGLFALVCVQIVLGAFVAGLDGGRSYIDWPLFDGRLAPEAYGALEPAWRNAFDNPVAAQVNHRFAGYLVALAAIAAPFLVRGQEAALRRLAWTAAGIALAQAALGVVTLVNAAPVALSAAHQLGAVALFLASLTLTRAAGLSSRR